MPCVICDGCGQRIVRASDALALWIAPDTATPVLDAPQHITLAHVHKGECEERLIQKFEMGGDEFEREELAANLIRLFQSLGVTTERFCLTEPTPRISDGSEIQPKLSPAT